MMRKWTDQPAPVPVVLAALGVGVSVGLVSWGCHLESSPGERSNVGGPVVGDGEAVETLQLPLQEAPCTIEVDGYGEVDIEDDYIPNVVACENGQAPMEALKAQAVQARGYIYYKLFVAGADSVENSTGDQVYDCDYTDAQQRHFDAAEATRGQYLRWNDEIVATFYVAGAIPGADDGQSAADACVGTGDDDPTDTEQWVTYNQGLAGCDIEMTPLGWVPDDCHDNPHNRGCASQNGQSCLADQGWSYEQMLPYYYGEDIELETAGGACGADPTEPDEHDEHCQGRDDGWSCFDDDQRVLCAEGLSTGVESCPEGCEAGECQGESQLELFCGEDTSEDGWHCLDDTSRVECHDAQPVGTDDCASGCEDGSCVDTDDAQPGDGNGDGDDDDDGDAAHSGDEQTAGDEQVMLVSESPGIDGGCNQGATAAGLPAAVALLLVMLMKIIRVISSRTAGRLHPPARG